MVQETGFNPESSHTKDSKMVLDHTLLSTHHYKVRIKSKVKQSKELKSALPYSSPKLLKREPSGYPRLISPAFV